MHTYRSKSTEYAQYQYLNCKLIKLRTARGPVLCNISEQQLHAMMIVGQSHAMMMSSPGHV